MGEARRRGTFEERRAQAIEQKMEEQQEWEEKQQLEEWRNLSPEQKRRRIQAAQFMALAAGMEMGL